MGYKKEAYFRRKCYVRISLMLMPIHFHVKPKFKKFIYHHTRHKLTSTFITINAIALILITTLLIELNVIYR